MFTPDMTKGHTQDIVAAATAKDWPVEWIAYALATAWHETAHTMMPVEEANWLSAEWRRHNLRYYPWHGRGFVQLTWEVNYKKMATLLKRPELATTPTLMLTDTDLSIQCLLVGMEEGTFTGRKLSTYDGGGTYNYLGARRIVNGVDKKHLIAKYAIEYEAYLRAHPPKKSRPNPLAAFFAFFARLFKK